MKWVRFWLTWKGNLLKEKYVHVQIDFPENRLQKHLESFVRYRVQDMEDCGYEEVDFPSKEWLEKKLNMKEKQLYKLTDEVDELSALLENYSRKNKINIILDNIKK